MVENGTPRFFRAVTKIGKFVSGIRDQGSGIRDQGSGIRDQGSEDVTGGFAAARMLGAGSYLLPRREAPMNF
ncbi:MAG: hypothetical protein LBI62_10485 [Candidatus Accumulibacter sp.]|nr:hypothetical protein [Accumulibacter sp.]